MDKIFYDLVPALTANSSGYGVAFASSIEYSNNQPYNAFDKIYNEYTNNIWHSSGTSAPFYLGFTFPNNDVKKVYLVKIFARCNNYSPKSVTLQAYNGESWEDLKSYICITDIGINSFYVN